MAEAPHRNREQQAREWIEMFLAASDEERIANVRLMLASRDDAIKTIERDRARERAAAGTPPTADQAASRAAEVLERADMEPNPDMVDSKVRIAEGWTGLAQALAEMARL